MRKPRNWNADIEVGSICNDIAYRYEDPLQGVRLWGSLDDLDRTQLPGCIEDVKRGEALLRQFRLQLEALVDSDRTCPSCGDPVAGRADRVFCSTRCRVRAHRANPN